MRYFAHIGYNGFNYRGWQRQARGIISVQQVLEETISKLLKQKIVCIGCGRTDAMVHASQYFFHFDFYEELPKNFLFKFNKSLPDDIAIFDIIPMDGYPHAQLDAVERTYEYYIHTQKNPFLHSLSALYQEENLNLEKMKQAVQLLPNYSDYSLFCKSPNKNDSNICQVFSTSLFVNPQGDRIRFQISANRFIQGMIRVIAKRLLDIGIGKLSVEDFEAILAGKNIPKEITIAYPQGLYLSQVKYPFLPLPTEKYFNPSNSQIWNEL
ncbi:MAG TPA: tRNA pseudouridine synthase A [Tenuifilaceae bacterium]|nr:tRNA pseudouridine synthase A [Tenuifilaceae bacterium]HPJ46852.1 tRNA pseudouridine synthase A [Tenuifilaceae bacterium]HPQ35301.1 tRNA pseudouridine synthase A [Tenuifilaceae bacterium]